MVSPLVMRELVTDITGCLTCELGNLADPPAYAAGGTALSLLHCLSEAVARVRSHNIPGALSIL
jgi:hypothetical protein